MACRQLMMRRVVVVSILVGRGEASVESDEFNLSTKPISLSIAKLIAPAPTSIMLVIVGIK